MKTATAILHTRHKVGLKIKSLEEPASENFNIVTSLIITSERVHFQIFGILATYVVRELTALIMFFAILLQKFL
jgi:hypothetical protein